MSAEPAAEPATARFAPGRRKAVTFALLLVTSLAALESTVISTAMPTIIGELRGLSQYSWVFSAYLLGSTISMPTFGRLADLHGRRRILLGAIGLFLAGAGACAAAQTMPQLIVARLFQGIGAGGLLPISLTVSGDLFSLQERAKIQGWFSAVWGTASLAGPLIGAWLTLTYGWRSIFSINVPLGIVAFVLVWTQMIETRARVTEPLDVAGALTLGGGCAALMLAVLQRAGGASVPPVLRLVLLVVGVMALVVFVRLQRSGAHPLVPPALFTRPEVVAPYAGGLLLGTTIYGVDTFVPLYVQGALGGTAMAAGSVVTPIVLLWAVSAAVAARGMVRFGFRRTAVAGAVLIFAGFGALIAAVVAGAPMIAVILACALVGCGLGPSSISQVLAIQHAVQEPNRGVATSLVPFSRTMGGALGVGALGALLAAGLTHRLGAAAVSADHLLAGGGEAASAAVRASIGSSLVPVFAALLLLAAANVWIANRFPD